jgi:tRNA uridine 5-carbamoylmethylation protein Kti12
MKIILLSGRPSSGKSTTLNLLYDKLMESGKCSVISEKTPRDSFDFECVLSYNNKTVAIYTSGDVYQWCVEAIVKYANCDVLVLAYSNKFARSLEKIVKTTKCKYYHSHHVSKKQRATDSDNEKVCAEILEQIQRK